MDKYHQNTIHTEVLQTNHGHGLFGDPNLKTLGATWVPLNKKSRNSKWLKMTPSNMLSKLSNDCAWKLPCHHFLAKNAIFDVASHQKWDGTSRWHSGKAVEVGNLNEPKRCFDSGDANWCGGWTPAMYGRLPLMYIYIYVYNYIYTNIYIYI